MTKTKNNSKYDIINGRHSSITARPIPMVMVLFKRLNVLLF